MLYVQFIFTCSDVEYEYIQFKKWSVLSSDDLIRGNEVVVCYAFSNRQLIVTIYVFYIYTILILCDHVCL